MEFLEIVNLLGAQIFGCTLYSAIIKLLIKLLIALLKIALF